MAERYAYKFKQLFGSKQQLIKELENLNEDSYIPVWIMGLWKIGEERLVIEGAEEVFGAKKTHKVVAYQLYDGVWLVTLVEEK